MNGLFLGAPVNILFAPGRSDEFLQNCQVYSYSVPPHDIDYNRRHGFSNLNFERIIISLSINPPIFIDIRLHIKEDPTITAWSLFLMGYWTKSYSSILFLPTFAQ
jgi:hypothetical protein